MAFGEFNKKINGQVRTGGHWERQTRTNKWFCALGPKVWVPDKE